MTSLPYTMRTLCVNNPDIHDENGNIGAKRCVRKLFCLLNYFEASGALYSGDVSSAHIFSVNNPDIHDENNNPGARRRVLKLFCLLTCFEASGPFSSSDLSYAHVCAVKCDAGAMLRVSTFFHYLTCFKARSLSLHYCTLFCTRDQIVEKTTNNVIHQFFSRHHIFIFFTDSVDDDLNIIMMRKHSMILRQM